MNEQQLETKAIELETETSIGQFYEKAYTLCGGTFYLELDRFLDKLGIDEDDMSEYSIKTIREQYEQLNNRGHSVGYNYHWFLSALDKALFELAEKTLKEQGENDLRWD